MAYSVWLEGTKIGETDLELRHGTRRRAGVFRPTEYGLSVLPGITAMGPALLDMGRMGLENPVLADPGNPDFDTETAKVLETPEGRRMLAAAEQISRLELRDSAGKTVAWKSLLISDFAELAAMARGRSNDPPPERPSPASEPVRYLISTTLHGKPAAARDATSKTRIRS